MQWLETFVTNNPGTAGLFICFGVLFFLLKHFFSKLSGWAEAAFSVFFIFASVVVFVSLFVSEERLALKHVVVFLFVYGVMLYIFLCDVLLLGGARWLTRKRGEKWVKEMDYLYLTLGAVGVFGTLNRLDMLDERFTRADIFAPLILASAVVIRFIKTRAEIAGWNKE